MNTIPDLELKLAMESIQRAVAAGELEEVPDKPGFYRLTAKGEAVAIAQLQTPEGQEVFRKLDEAYKAGKI